MTRQPGRAPKPSIPGRRSDLGLLAPSRRSFVLRRLHSLTGVAPVGVFLAVHLWTNAAALSGPAAYDRAVSRIQALPGLGFIEAAFVLVPLAFHALFGLALVSESSPNAVAYPYARNWMYLLQRVTGAIALVFVAAHVCEYRVASFTGRMSAHSFYPTLVRRLSSTSFGLPWVAFGYLLGIASTVAHWANGMSTFFTTWGVARSRRSRTAFAVASSIAGLVLFALGSFTVIYFATGLEPTGPTVSPSRGTETAPGVLEKR